MERYGNIKGGKVIGVGSYGCVFHPPLPCKKGKQPTDDMVSKLMDTNDANKEMSEINKITNRLREIPDARRYFGGFDTYICEAESISPSDVRDYDCQLSNVTHLTNDARLSSELPNLSILQQKDLGKTVNDYLLLDINDKKDLHLFLGNMVNLLFKGVLPMNEVGAYHLDIKSDNVLVREHCPVLIDWGLCYLTDDNKPVTNAETRGKRYNPEVTNVPMKAYCMFNEPLVARAFYETADTEGGNLDPHGLSSMHTSRTVLNILYHNEWDQDHIKHLIREIVNPVIEIMVQHYAYRHERYPYSSGKSMVTQYLSRQRDLYLINGYVDHDKLYADFFYNVDIWGWVMAFTPLLRSNVSGTRGKLSSIMDDDERRKIRLMAAKCIEYLFVCETRRYDIGVLVAYIEDVITGLE